MNQCESPKIIDNQQKRNLLNETQKDEVIYDVEEKQQIKENKEIFFYPNDLYINKEIEIEQNTNLKEDPTNNQISKREKKKSKKILKNT